MSSAFMGKVEYKSTFRAVQGFSCPVFDKLNDLFSAVALGTICNPVGRKTNILFKHQAEAGAFAVKFPFRFHPGAFFFFHPGAFFRFLLNSCAFLSPAAHRLKAALCGCFASGLLLCAVLPPEAAAFDKVVPGVPAEHVTGDESDDKASSDGDHVLVKNELQEVGEPFHDYLYVFLMFSIIGFIVGIVACGIYTLTMSDEKFKSYHDKLYNRSEWNICQRIVLLWFFWQMLFAFHLHGKPCSYTTHNMYYELAYSTVCLAILYFGGFWKCKQKALKGEEND